jgi:hypothetical protein
MVKDCEKNPKSRFLGGWSRLGMTNLEHIPRAQFLVRDGLQLRPGAGRFPQ